MAEVDPITIAACWSIFMAAAVCVLMLVQRAIDRRVAARLDKLAAVIQQQADKETALIKLVQETLTEARLALSRIDERELARPRSKLV